MEVIRCRCSYLHRHPLQILHSVSWEISFGEEGSHSPCSASFSRLVRQAEDTVAEFYYACWENPSSLPQPQGQYIYIYIYRYKDNKLKPFFQHFGVCHVMEVTITHTFAKSFSHSQHVNQHGSNTAIHWQLCMG